MKTTDCTATVRHLPTAPITNSGKDDANTAQRPPGTARTCAPMTSEKSKAERDGQNQPPRQ
jgi:hypothetical protein